MRNGKRIGAWVAVAGLFLAGSLRMASAGVVETIREDLRPVSGTVLLQREGEVLVDLDARHGLRVGDLLSVVAKGQEVIHPRTGEVIGRLDEAKAVLKITRIKSGFAIARPLSGSESIAKGDVVRRFAYLKALFRGPAGGSKTLYNALRDALPELEWQGLFSIGDPSAREVQADLVFSLNPREVQMFDREGKLLRSWVNPASAESGVSPPVAGAARQPALPKPENPPAAPALPEPEGKGASPVLWAGGKVDFGPFASLGELPDRVLMAAFQRDGKRILLATVDGEHVRVFSVDKGLQPLAVVDLSGRMAMPVAVAWWRPEKSGPLYLAVTAVEEISRNYGQEVTTRLSGEMFEFAGQSLRLAASSIRYFLGTFDRDGDGVSETLLGQEFAPEFGFGRTYVLRLEDGKVGSGKPEFELPREFTVLGSVIGDLNGDGRAETAFVRNGNLWMHQGTRKVYVSSAGMGGSISTMTYDVNPGAQDTMFSVMSLEVPPFLQDIDGDGVPEILVVAAETGFLKVPGIGPGIKKSWVAVLKFQGGEFRKGRLPGDLENPIQGLWSDGKQVYLVETRTTSSLSKEGSSSLLTFPLGTSAR